MATIRMLPEGIINKIAAGEVVERPASVVKELVENALDAGAGQIFITLNDGGKEYISVLDNGLGMDDADARMAVQRHATSKLRDEKELESIRTLGFRGEALASIAAVSRFELVTCGDEQQGGTRLIVEGGTGLSVGRMGFPRGSRVTVRDLFFNTPARRKFLRATSTEIQHIQTLFTQTALANSGVHFRLTHNRRQLHDLPPCPGLEERVFQLFGEEFAGGMVAVHGGEGSFSYEGMLCFPSHSKSSRRWQYLFVNSRPVRHNSLSHGIYQAYRTLLMKDRHPAYILMLGIPPEEVDVNVHPAKTEVRLRNQQFLHSVLARQLHKELLESSRRRAFGVDAPAGPVEDRIPGGAARAREAGPAPGQQAELPLVAAAMALPGPEVDGGGRAQPRSAGPGPPPPGGFADGATLRSNPMEGGDFHFQALSGLAGHGEITPERPSGAGGLELLGQFNNSYLLAQREGQLIIVDQHAAHERILFEKYRSQFYGGNLLTEPYLLPLTMNMSPQNALLLEQYLPEWSRMGFVIEPFGRSTYLVREAPALLHGRDVERLILEVLDELALFGKSGRVEEVINEILERVACHGALRAGMSLGTEEMESLLAQLEQLDISLYCPHGRPVWVELPLRELERRFKRTV